MAIIPVYPYGTDSEVTGVSKMRAFHIKMERGGLKNTGAMDNDKTKFNGYIRSSMLIRTNDATKVTGKTLTGFTVYEYKVVNNAIVYNKVSSEGDTFHADTRYIKIVKQSSTLPEEVVLMFDGDVEEVYNVQIESGTSGNNLLSEMLIYQVSEGICTTARLLLPYNYSIDGKKVPLILWNPCDGSFIGWNDPIDKVGYTPASIKTQLEYLADEGFAVLEIYPWGSYHNTNYPQCGMSGAVPVPVTLTAMEKGVAYATSRFNISDSNIFQTSWSGSGKLSSYYAIHRPNFNLRAVYAFAPVVDGGVWRASGETLGGASGYRAAVNSEMHFNGTAEEITNYLNKWNDDTNCQGELDFVKANAEKFSKFLSITWQNMSGRKLVKDNSTGEYTLQEYTIEDKIADTVAFGEAWCANHNAANIYNRHDFLISGDGVPITIIAAYDDEGCPFLAMEEFIIMLQNGGAEAKIVPLPRNSGGHGAAINGNTQSNVTTKRGNTYATVPYGWWYAVQDIKARFLKQ